MRICKFGNFQSLRLFVLACVNDAGLAKWLRIYWCSEHYRAMISRRGFLALVILFPAIRVGNCFFCLFSLHLLLIACSIPFFFKKKKGFSVVHSSLSCVFLFSFYGDSLLHHSSHQQYFAVGLQSQWYVSHLRHPAVLKSAKRFISALASVQAQLDAEQAQGRLQWQGADGREGKGWIPVTLHEAGALLFCVGMG